MGRYLLVMRMILTHRWSQNSRFMLAFCYEISYVCIRFTTPNQNYWYTIDNIMEPYLPLLNPLCIKMLCLYQLLTRVPKIFDLCPVTVHFQVKRLMFAQQRLGTGLVSTIVLARYPGKLLTYPGFYLSYLGEELRIKNRQKSVSMCSIRQTHFKDLFKKSSKLASKNKLHFMYISFVSHSLHIKCNAVLLTGEKCNNCRMVHLVYWPDGRN